MFRASSEEILSNIFKKKLLKYGESNNSIFILLQFMEKITLGNMIFIKLQVYLIYVNHQYLNSIMKVLKDL